MPLTIPKAIRIKKFKPKLYLYLYNFISRKNNIRDKGSVV